ncbi:MAG: hypothetical protein HOM14_16995 [Gammaproteobacteria bacterium]|jgi:hypothetical protein|nr:hypothetical protein [Gammaproteobacteria bacterium]MBT3721964.1 hypothetical protein [Gammaproteobacteria bacterium]MBT4078835.1 hypothetical protein [Gammaproteobacteria bacterium]MBT4193261.1 hypothetical protein [Gammaproteobacteria bacterium]MBT4451302.1 hypothetical protein [Gammaproteobacteria bacterium]
MKISKFKPRYEMTTEEQGKVEDGSHQKLSKFDTYSLISQSVSVKRSDITKNYLRDRVED